MLFRHPLPGARISVLKCEALRVRSVAENDRILALFHRAKNVGAQHETIVHRDRHVPVDPNAIADLGALLMRRNLRPPWIILLLGGQATEHEEGRKCAGYCGLALAPPDL